MVAKGAEVRVRDRECWKTLSMQSSFRHRCASALMYSATVIAVARLQCNDAAFKVTWPGSWVTGKLIYAKCNVQG